MSRIVAAARSRLSKAGVPGLTRVETGEPATGWLTHNLLIELRRSGTLTPADLKQNTA